jgi:spore coat protein CotH
MSAHLRPLVCAALALILCGVSQAQVQINEIMYHPGSGESGDEFVELYNSSGGVVDLTGWSFDGIDYTFPPGSSITAGGYLVLASNATQFFETYDVTADGLYLLELGDAGERLVLLDDPDGLGPSLEVIDPDQDNSIPRNWHASTSAGGSPRALNSVDASGLPPWIENVQHTSDVLQNDPVVVTAAVYGATTVQLTYKIDWGAETTIDMYDDGGHGDGDPGDLVYGASIPGQPEGTLIRYRIAVTDGSANMYYPRDDDTVAYDGTAVIDPALTSSLPILHWFMDPGSCSAGSDNPGAACQTDVECPNGGCDGYAPALNHKLTNETEPAVLFYDGVLYDGVQARIRGQSARYWTKPPWKFYMTQGHELAAPDVFDTTVDTFDLQSNWSDKAFMREVLAWETHRDSGGISCQAHPVHVQKDGAFFGLYTFLEAPELDWVERNGLDPDGSRYKAFDDLRSYSYYDNIVPKYEKKSRLYEDHTDIFIFTNGLNNLTGQQLRDFLYDNVDIPKTLNYLATQIIIHNNDHIKKNYFVYRDTEGTQRWTMQPWDLDLTFGRNWVYDVLVDTIWADVDYLTGLSDISPSHPYFGTSDRQKLGGAWNRLIDRLLDEDDIRQMYCRRLRSLMDELLPVGRYESRVDELAALIGTEVPLDHTE